MSAGLFTLQLHFARTPPAAWASVARRLVERPMHETAAEKKTAYADLFAGLRSCLPDASAGAWAWSPASGAPEDAYRALVERLAIPPATPSLEDQPLAAWCAVAFLVSSPTPASERIDVLTAVPAAVRRRRSTFDHLLAHLHKLDFRDVPGDGLFLRPRDLGASGTTGAEPGLGGAGEPWPLESR